MRTRLAFGVILLLLPIEPASEHMFVCLFPLHTALLYCRNRKSKRVIKPVSFLLLGPSLASRSCNASVLIVGVRLKPSSVIFSSFILRILREIEKVIFSGASHVP